MRVHLEKRAKRNLGQSSSRTTYLILNLTAGVEREPFEVHLKFGQSQPQMPAHFLRQDLKIYGRTSLQNIWVSPALFCIGRIQRCTQR